MNMCKNYRVDKKISPEACGNFESSLTSNITKDAQVLVLMNLDRMFTLNTRTWK